MHQNDLERFFYERPHRFAVKWRHYFSIYDRHLARFRGRPVTFVEIGVNRGGSLQMWRDYLGPRSRIIGVDVNPECKALEETGIEILIGDQGDPEFLRRLVDFAGPIDAFLDDGGHTMAQQLTTFDICYPAVASDGVYMCEDVHTSYWPHYGGGRGEPGSFVEAMKRRIDELHAWHLNDDDAAVGDFARTTNSLHFYDSVVVLEKALRERPGADERGD
jgi:23S rRNA U2552 (ribose-2'-O)-methylase RlmE/FtsJ